MVALVVATATATVVVVIIVVVVVVDHHLAVRDREILLQIALGEERFLQQNRSRVMVMVGVMPRVMVLAVRNGRGVLLLEMMKRRREAGE